MNVGQLALDNLEKYGEYRSLQFEGRDYTNVERDAWSRRLAGLLRSKGVQPGDRVLVMMPNTPEILSSFQAVWKIGAVIVPVTPMLNAREVGYLLESSEAKVALTTPILAARIKDASKSFAGFEHLLVIGETNVEGAEDVSSAIDSAEPVNELVDRAGEDMAILLYTSGTTGQPKGVMLTHDNLLTNAKSVVELNNIEPFSPAMHMLPLSHSFGIMTMNIGAIYGTQAIMLSHFDPLKALQAIESFKVERFSAVPTMLTYLINHPEREKFDCSSLTEIHTGGAALPNEVRLEFERLFGCKVREGYGLSETAPTACGYREGEDYRVGSVGRAISGVEVCIMNFDNKQLLPNQSGEICIKGPNVMKGYWKNEEATREAVIDDWFHSGDIGHMDEDGFVYITDRKKDLIIKGGENISPREIEEAIYEHPAVAECAVVGVPDPTFGETIAAVVVNKPGHSVTQEELIGHIANYVTKFKLPSWIQFSAYLPKNPTGKILKKDIRTTVAAWVDKQKAKQRETEKV